MRITALVSATAGLFIALAVTAAPAHAMNKAELVDAIATSSGLSKADAKRALEGFIEKTTAALKKGDKISLVGFGSFSISAGAVTDPSDPSASLGNGKPLKPVKVKDRNGNRSAGTIALGENGTWELVVGLPDASFYDETLELEAKMPKPLDPRLVELSLRLPTNAPGSNVAAVVASAAAGGTGVVLEVSLPPGTFDEFTFDAADPDPDFHAAFYTSVHADVATDPCAESVLADRLGFDGDTICPVGTSCDLDQTTRDELIVAMSSASGLDPSSIASVLDAIRTLSYPPPIPDATSLSGFGSFSVSKRAARTGRNPQTGKTIKIAAKNVVKFKAGKALSSTVK